MSFKPVFLWTDWVLWIAALGVLAYGFHVARHPQLRASWRRVWRDPSAMCAGVVLAFFALITLVDSVHFRRALPPRADANTSAAASATTTSTTSTTTPQVFYATRTESLLDLVLSSQASQREATYSRPLAYLSFTKESVELNGKTVRTHPRLAYGGRHLTDPEQQWAGDVLMRGALGLLGGALVAGLAIVGVAAWLDRGLTGGPGKTSAGMRAMLGRLWRDETDMPWRAGLITLTAIVLLCGLAVGWSGSYHVLGTDRGGADVLYNALKSIRTAFVIGTLATVATLPLAIVLGILAGYLRGWVDEVIQYLYTVMSSVPNVLLIAACVLMVQVYLDKHPEMFETGLERADLKIFLLCVILGLTGWAGLCRLLRGETLKLRELDYVQAATAFGVAPGRIMLRHILPNVMHLVLINTVLEFSALILYEAVLSYVGVGVDPSMSSFGGMINLGRDEMSRDPIVWWSFAAAFAFMVSLVLAANLFADGVRDAFDPRARSFRVRLLPSGAKS